MNCYVIDDEQHAIDTLVRYIAKCPELSLMGSSTSAARAIAELKNLPAVNLIFLDVDMPDISGLEAVALLPPTAGLIFTTAHTNYAYDAFESNAIGFLLKPVSFAKFTKALIKAESLLAAKQSIYLTVEKATPGFLFINANTRGKVVQVKTDEIVYIEGLKNYIVIYTETGKHITYLTLTEALSALPENLFVRAHKSFIVNIRQIKAVESNTVMMNGNIAVTIGQSYKEGFTKVIDLATLKSKRKLV